MINQTLSVFNRRNSRIFSIPTTEYLVNFYDRNNLATLKTNNHENSLLFRYYCVFAPDINFFRYLHNISNTQRSLQIFFSSYRSSLSESQSVNTVMAPFC